MTNYKMNPDKVLIVCGYTNDELLKKSSKKYKKQIGQPPTLFFSVKNIEYTPKIKNYEEFNSAEGLILIEKATDRFAEVQMDIMVNQLITDTKGSIMIDKKTREAKLRVVDTNSLAKETTQGIKMKCWVDPAKFTESFLKVRNAFFDDLYGRPLTIVSPLFPAMPVAYLTECSYNIEEGSEEASYTVTFRETESLGT